MESIHFARCRLFICSTAFCNSLGLTITFRLPLTMSIGELIRTERVLEMVKVKGICGESDTADREHIKAEVEDT